MAVFCCPRIPRQQKILYKLLHQYLEYVSDGHVHRRQHHNRLFSGGNTTAGSFGILFGGRVSAYTDSGGYLVIAGLFHGQRLYCNKEKLSVIFNDCRRRGIQYYTQFSADTDSPWHIWGRCSYSLQLSPFIFDQNNQYQKYPPLQNIWRQAFHEHFDNSCSDNIVIMGRPSKYRYTAFMFFISGSNQYSSSDRLCKVISFMIKRLPHEYFHKPFLSHQASLQAT